MDTNEKVKRFASLESLKEEIKYDCISRDMLAQRYCVRFIMLNNFHEFKKLAIFMNDIGVKSLDLENLMEEGENDDWITKTMLKDAIKKCTESTFVTPFSEIARFFNDEDFRGFFNEIMLLEDIRNPKKRIYIPLIGLQNRFTDFLNHFARLSESAPVWRYDAEPQSVEVYFSQYKNFELPNSNVQCQLDSLRDWLKFWKVQAPQERIVCCSQPIAAKAKYSKPDNIFQFTRISTSYEFMTRFLELSFPFGFDEAETPFWDKMVETINSAMVVGFKFEEYVRHTFNKLELAAPEILGEWARTDATDFHRWLLKKYVTETEFGREHPYLKLCLESVSDLNDREQLPSMVATRLLYANIPANLKEAYAEERRCVIQRNRSFFADSISHEEQNRMFEIIKDIFQKDKDLDFAMKLCTGVFDFEKNLLIGWYAHHSEHNKVVENIRVLFPDFHAYLQPFRPTHAFNQDMQWALDYVQSYKMAKIRNRLDESITSVIKQRNADNAAFYNWYYKFENSHETLAGLTNIVVNKPDRVYWIDGLGAEFFSYILYLVDQEHSNLNLIRSQLTRADIPSSTAHNRFEGDNVRKFGALDELGHNSHGYSYPKTLVRELGVLREIVHEICVIAKKETCTIAIVSDHGLSCLSCKAPSKKYEGKIEHEGRYMKTTEYAVSDTDYIVHTNETDGEQYKVALTHSSLSKVPTHQVHGGCTPEEVLVPFLLFSNKGVASMVSHEIQLADYEIMLSSPAVKVTIFPDVKSVKMECDGKSYDMEKKGAQWTAVIQNAKEGKQNVVIVPEGGTPENIQINIKGIGGVGLDDFMDF